MCGLASNMTSAGLGRTVARCIVQPLQRGNLTRSFMRGLSSEHQHTRTNVDHRSGAIGKMRQEDEEEHEQMLTMKPKGLPGS